MTHVLTQYGLPILFAVVLAESFGIPLPALRCADSPSGNLVRRIDRRQGSSETSRAACTPFFKLI